MANGKCIRNQHACHDNNRTQHEQKKKIEKKDENRLQKYATSQFINSAMYPLHLFIIIRLNLIE